MVNIHWVRVKEDREAPWEICGYEAETLVLEIIVFGQVGPMNDGIKEKKKTGIEERDLGGWTRKYSFSPPRGVRSLGGRESVFPEIPAAPEGQNPP
jgi:hypothetical protein